MPMERSQSTEFTRSPTVLSIECLKGSSKADEWNGSRDMLQTGDIVEEIQIGSDSGSGGTTLWAPFKSGKSGMQKILHTSFKKKETLILVRVRRGADEFAQLQACIVPNESGGKKQYMLRSIGDPNYAVGFADRTEAECLELQASRGSRMVNALSNTKLQDGYVSYPWEKRMKELLFVPNSSSFLSLLLLPKASDQVASRYNTVEDTLARANAWLNASQSSGVPIVFTNIQTESLLTKISGETASSTVNSGSLSDLSNLANASLYGFEDYHGVDIGVVRAVRLWYAPIAGEIPLEIILTETDTKLGFAISRTEEGFIYISSVIDSDEDMPSTRSGLSDLYKEAASSSKLLVVSRVSNQKVLPWMVSSTGAVRCFDTVSLSQKLSLHRHAKVPILLHIFLWDKETTSGNDFKFESFAPTPLPWSPEVRLFRVPHENQIMPLPLPIDEIGNESSVMNEDELRLERYTAGAGSFKFHDFPLPSNWV